MSVIGAPCEHQLLIMTGSLILRLIFSVFILPAVPWSSVVYIYIYTCMFIYIYVYICVYILQLAIAGISFRYCVKVSTLFFVFFFSANQFSIIHRYFPYGFKQKHNVYSYKTWYAFLSYIWHDQKVEDI